MTPQEIFDTVARHLFTQGERAGVLVADDVDGDPDFACKYRAPGGRSCAVGVLIPDKAYREDMEGTGIMGVYTAFSGVLPGWMADNLKLLTSLQSVHDDYHSWKSTATLREALFIAADFHGLNASVLEGLALIKSNVD
jgi:hypothetical protein